MPRAHAYQHAHQTERYQKRYQTAQMSSSQVPLSQVRSRQTVSHAKLTESQPAMNKAQSKAQSKARSPGGAPLFVKRYVRWLFGKQSATNHRANQRANHGTAASRQPIRKSPQKGAIATGSVATLALLIIVPSQVFSQATAQSDRNGTCQEVIRSGAEISREALFHLLSVPAGATNESVRELIGAPYCLLPSESNKASEARDAESNLEANPQALTVREAYPLAFDPSAWIVVNYSENAYAGYDFVFKP